MNNFVLIGKCVGYMPPIDLIKLEVGEDMFIVDISDLKGVMDCNKVFTEKVTKKATISVYGSIKKNDNTSIYLKAKKIIFIDKGSEE